MSTTFELPPNTSRVIIGPDGIRRKALEKKTVTSIRVLPGNSPSVGLCQVTARTQIRLDKAKQTILDFIEDARIQTSIQNNLPLPDDVLVEHLTIEDALVGILIGKQGISLLELMIEAGCRLVVSNANDKDNSVRQITIYARGKDRMANALMHVKTQIKRIGSGEVSALARLANRRGAEPKLNPISVNFTYRREIMNPELANALILVKSYIPYICKDSDAHIVLFRAKDKIIITGKDEKTVDEGLNILTNLNQLPCRNIDCEHKVSFPYDEKDGQEGYCKACAPIYLDPEYIKARSAAFQEKVATRRERGRKSKESSE